MTPASTDVFEAVESAFLDAKQQELFHQVTVQNLFMSEQGQQDIQPIIAVLCTQVQKPTEKG